MEVWMLVWVAVLGVLEFAFVRRDVTALRGLVLKLGEDVTVLGGVVLNLGEEVRVLRCLSGGYEFHVRCPGLMFRWFNVRMGWKGAVAMSHMGSSAMLSCSGEDLRRLVRSARGIVDGGVSGVDQALVKSAQRLLDGYDHVLDASAD